MNDNEFTDKKTERNEQTTHFGYQQVPLEKKVEKVGDVFHSVAEQYDVMNDLMSFGIHRLWKRQTIWQAACRPGQMVLDLAGGTGDLTKALAKQVGEKGHVILGDINASMLRRGRDRLTDLGLVSNISYTQANAECLPFDENTFD